MSDEQRRDDEEVESHISEVHVHEEPGDDDDVEVHIMKTSNVRME